MTMRCQPWLGSSVIRLALGDGGRFQPVDDGQEEIRRRGQVEDAVALGAPFGVDLAQPLIQPAVRLRIGEITPHVAQSLGEPLPGILGDRGARIGGDRLAHLFAELVIAPIAMRDADDRESLGEGLPDGQVIERRHQLARREIAADAEDDHRRRGDHAVDFGRAERIQRLLRLSPGVDGMRPDLGRTRQRQVERFRNGAFALVGRSVRVVVGGVSVIGSRASHSSKGQGAIPPPPALLTRR